MLRCEKSLYKPGAAMVHIVGFMYVAMSAAPGTRPAKVYLYDAATLLHYMSVELISSVLPWCTLSQQLYRIPASAFDGLHTECPAGHPPSVCYAHQHSHPDVPLWFLLGDIRRFSLSMPC